MFNKISINGVLSINVLFFIIALLVFNLKKAKKYNPFECDEFLKIINVIKQDKILKILSILFIFYIISQLVIIFFIPVSFGDALSYYFQRCAHWIQAGNINHYDTYDVRELIMPTNMEFLYTWMFLFTKNECGCGIFSFFAFLNSIYVLYKFIGELGFCRRKRLWTVFVFSSVPIIYSMANTPLADLFIGSLILSSLYLFVLDCKYSGKMYLYFAALSYALAIGTKTTSLIAFPMFLLACVIIAFIFKKKMKNIILFIIFLIINVLIFSSYNYVLNYIQYGNFLSSPNHILLNHFRGGMQGYLYNIVNYLFLIFDMSGIPNIDFYNDFVIKVRDYIYGFFDIAKCISPFYDRKYPFNSEISPLYSFLGAVGIFAFYPALISAFCKIKSYSNSSKILFILAMSYIINILLFSGLMIFTEFNARYIVTFFVLASPVIVFTYIKSKLYKIFLAFIMSVYLFVIPFSEAFGYFNAYIKFCVKNIDIQNKYEKFNREFNDEEEVYLYLKDKAFIKVGLIAGASKRTNFDIIRLQIAGKIIDKLPIETMKEYSLADYDYIIVFDEPEQKSSFISYKEYNSPNYIADCTYYDTNNEKILKQEGINLLPGVKIICDTPFSYIENSGFEKDKDFISTDYIIYKRKK
ncbi:hypothetical protein IJ182_00935 [bacterium]|nr:hypothetical protein [bacterium]